MRTKMAVLVIAVVLAAACTSQERGPADQGPANGLSGGVLLLGSDVGVRSLDPATGRVLFDGTGVPALGSWSPVFSTAFSGGRTTIEGRDAATGVVESRLSLLGDLSIRVASHDGSRVALMAPLPKGGSPWIPEARARTTIVVADPTGGEKPVRYRLAGNLEPEAFSWDGRSLFLIRFVPPTDPVAYRVAQLELDRGKVFPVSTGQKGVVETMSGTRLEQIASSDGTMLYTLYTTQSASYATGHTKHGAPVAFVHTLALDEGWAHCIPLPKQFWGGDPAHEAMALSPDGDRLYVVDTARDLAAVMDVGGLRFGPAATVDFASAAEAEAQAVAAVDGTVFASAGSQVTALDPDTLEAIRTWSVDEPVSALGSGPEGLYLAVADGVRIVDPSTGHPAGAIPTPAGEDVSFVGFTSR
jgi:hypothetical protein